MVPIARRNMLSDRAKFLVALGGVTLSIVLILVVQSLYQGVQRESAMFVRSLPGDLWVTQRGTTDLVFSNSRLAENAGNQIRRLEGITDVYSLSGRLMSFKVGDDEVRTYIMALHPLPGVTYARLVEFTPARGRIIVDSTFARQSGLSVGDPLVFGDYRFIVSEVRHVANVLVTQFAFISPDDFRAVFGVPANVNFFLVSLRDPSSAPAAIDEIERLVPDSEVFTSDAFAERASEKGTGDFLPVIRVIMVISFIVGLAVLSLTIYSATIERARDYAVLKALGASPLILYRLVLSQSFLISSLGFIAGVGLAFLFNSVAADMVPQFITYIRWQDVAFVLFVTAVMSFVASYLPVNRVARIDPAVVFRA